MLIGVGGLLIRPCMFSACGIHGRAFGQGWGFRPSSPYHRPPRRGFGSSGLCDSGSGDLFRDDHASTREMVFSSAAGAFTAARMDPVGARGKSWASSTLTHAVLYYGCFRSSSRVLPSRIIHSPTANPKGNPRQEARHSGVPHERTNSRHSCGGGARRPRGATKAIVFNSRPSQSHWRCRERRLMPLREHGHRVRTCRGRIIIPRWKNFSPISAHG